MFGVTRANRAVIYGTIKLQNLKWFVNVEPTALARAAKKKIYWMDSVMPAITSDLLMIAAECVKALPPSARLLLGRAGGVLDATMSCRCGCCIAPLLRDQPKNCNWVWKCWIYIILSLRWQWLNQFHWFYLANETRWSCSVYLIPVGAVGKSDSGWCQWLHLKFPQFNRKWTNLTGIFI